MKIKNIISDLEKMPKFKEWKKSNAGYFLAHIFMIVDKNGIKWEAGYCKGDKVAVADVDENGKLTIKTPEKIFKKPGAKVKPLDIDSINIDILDCLEKIHSIQHDKYPSELPVKKIVVLQNIEEGQVYNVTYVTSTMKTLNIKIDSATGEIKNESLEQLFQFTK